MRIVLGAATASTAALALLNVANADNYPPAAIANLQATCQQRKDIPPSAMGAYCACYVDLIQRDVSWRDFLLLDSAIQTKGVASLDAEEKGILDRAVWVTLYCSEKNTQ
jgi:hypothetical protein